MFTIISRAWQFGDGGTSNAANPSHTYAANGTVFKTNFWGGLPMPNVEQLFLGDGNLTAEQQEMPGRSGPYAVNDPLVFKLFTIDQPFFLNFPFGYTSEGVNWYEAAGVPLTAFDDYGRENPWPLRQDLRALDLNDLLEFP